MAANLYHHALTVFLAVGSIADRTGLAKEERLQRRALIWMGLLMSGGGLIWGNACVVLGLYLPALIPYGYAGLTLVNLSVLWASGAFERARLVQVSASLLLPFALQLALGGFVASGGMMLWALLALVGSLMISSGDQTRCWLLAYLLLTVVVGLLDAPARALVQPHQGSTALFISNVSTISVIMFGMISAMLGWRRANNETLQIMNRTISSLNVELGSHVIRAEEAERSARQANEAKSAFLANMSHELRTPLNAIIGYTELLMEDASGPELADMNRIHNASTHLLSLINDVLDLAKIEAGQMEIFWEDVDLLGLTEDVEATIKPLIQKHDNTLEIYISSELERVRSDFIKLKQILVNLLSNAAKFTCRGTITLTLEPHGATGLRLEVADTGIGMDEAALEKITKPFQQADTSTTRRYGGTGLGLSLVKHFAQMLGGELIIRSKLGEGTTITVLVDAGLAEA